MDTVALSPVAVPHVPPTVVMLAFVEYGNVRALPFTFVSVTVGAVVSTVNDNGPCVVLLPTLAPCVTVTVKFPLASVGDVVYVQLPALHAGVPLCADPVIVTVTVGASPIAVPQEPPMVVTAVFVLNGKVCAD